MKYEEKIERSSNLTTTIIEEMLSTERDPDVQMMAMHATLYWVCSCASLFDEQLIERAVKYFATRLVDDLPTYLEFMRDEADPGAGHA